MSVDFHRDVDFQDLYQLPCGLWLTVEREDGELLFNVAPGEDDHEDAGAVWSSIGWSSLYYDIISIDAYTPGGVLDIYHCSPEELAAHGGFSAISRVVVVLDEEDFFDEEL